MMNKNQNDISKLINYNMRIHDFILLLFMVCNLKQSLKIKKQKENYKKIHSKR